MKKRGNPAFTGVLNINKPSGITSHDVVDCVRKASHQKRVGHTGTLDPIATGVLPICLGFATRMARFLMAEDKEYSMTMRLGLTTDSQDITGKVLAESDAAGVTAEQFEQCLAKFRGAIEQVPPMVSAKHHKGQRLYELAREGLEVERQPVAVRIEALDLLAFRCPEADLRVTCSKGTYMRTLCHDIGQALGCGGVMSALVRTRCGCFKLSDAVDLEPLKGPDEISRHLVTMEAALSAFASVVIHPSQMRDWVTGQGLQSGAILQRSREFARLEYVRVLGADGMLLGVGQALLASIALDRMGGDLKVIKPEVVLGSTNNGRGKQYSD